MIWKSIFGAAVATALVPAFGVGRSQGATVNWVGKPAPSFSMKDLQGKTITKKALAGKVVLLDFWATWCPPCRMSSPVMQKLHTKFARKGLVVIGADAFERTPDPVAGAKAYAKEGKYTYRFTTGNDKLAETFGVQGIPTFVLIDRAGIVRKIVVGVPQGGADELYQRMVKDLAPLLARK